MGIRQQPKSTGVRRRFGTAFLVLLPLCAHAAVPPANAVTEVVRVVARVRGVEGPEREAALAELIELGVSAAPQVWDVLSGRAERPPEMLGALLDAQGKELLLKTIETWPSDAVVTHLEGLVRTGDTEDHLRAIEWLGRAGDATSLPAMRAHLDAVPGSFIEHVRLATEIEGALSSLLRRDPRTIPLLSSNLRELDTVRLGLVARCLPEVGTDAAFELLERLFSRSRALDRYALNALARWPLWTRPAADGHCARIARRHLDAADPELRRGAALVLGALRDEVVVEELLARLQDEDTRVRYAAEGALQRISGNTWKGSLVRWERWWEEESAWWDENREQLEELARTPNPLRLRLFLRELQLHPAHRHGFRDVLEAALTSNDSVLVSSAASALAHLELAGSASALADTLNHPNAGVRGAVSSALVRLTGATGPGTADEWHAWLAGE